MRRGILATLAAAVMAATTATPAAASESSNETCRRFGAEWKVCVWLLEPNPSGGRLYHVEICEGAMCVYLAEPDPN